MRAPRPARWLAPFAMALVVAAPSWAKRDSKGREIEIWSGDPLFALTSPWSGARLAAGETVRLAWNEAPGLGSEGWIEEWEAFLSLDAGRRYTVRLTPHLDLAKRSFSIRLPDIPTREARLMFRMGNERRELEIELPWTFEIVDARSPAGRSRIRSFARGETARGGEQGVVAWVEGGRDGSGAVEFAAELAYPGMRSVGDERRLRDRRRRDRVPRRTSFSLCALFSHPAAEVAVGADTPSLVEARSSSLDPRRSTCRQNE